MGNLRRFSGSAVFVAGIIIVSASAVSSQTRVSSDRADSGGGVTTAVKAVKRAQDPARRMEGAQAGIDAAIAIVNRFESEGDRTALLTHTFD